MDFLWFHFSGAGSGAYVQYLNERFGVVFSGKAVSALRRSFEDVLTCLLYTSALPPQGAGVRRAYLRQRREHQPERQRRSPGAAGEAAAHPGILNVSWAYKRACQSVFHLRLRQAACKRSVP